jgi:hypothetical protein
MRWRILTAYVAVIVMVRILFLLPWIGLPEPGAVAIVRHSISPFLFVNRVVLPQLDSLDLSSYIRGNAILIPFHIIYHGVLLLVGIHDVHQEIVHSEILCYRVVFNDLLWWLLVDFLIYFIQLWGILEGGATSIVCVTLSVEFVHGVERMLTKCFNSWSWLTVFHEDASLITNKSTGSHVSSNSCNIDHYIEVRFFLRLAFDHAIRVDIERLRH